MDVRIESETAFFQVRVTPRASHDAIEGEHQGALKVRLTAPPVDDRANEALRRLLAEELDVPVSAVRILSGARGRSKHVSVVGATEAKIRSLAQLPRLR